MEKLRRAVIREELLALTRDWGKAIILDKILFWTGLVYEMERSDRERIEEMKKIDPEKAAEFESKLRDGWFYKTVEEFEEEIFGVQSSKTINRKLNELILENYVLADKSGARNKTKYDRKIWYRANIELIQRDLLRLGYPLEGYKIPQSLLQSISQNEKCEESTFYQQEGELQESPKLPISQFKKWKSQTEKCKSQLEKSNSQLEEWISQNETTITDTTTDTTTNTTTDTNLSLLQNLPNILSMYLESEFFKNREREIEGLQVSDIITRYETLKDYMTVEKFIAVLDYLIRNNNRVLNFTTLFRLCEEKVDKENSKRKFSINDRELLPKWFAKSLDSYSSQQQPNNTSSYKEKLLKLLEPMSEKEV
ncbi:hypothetical protein [Calidifontibacillus erzurumensis]|uniref:hypothetical protein n=1 Tax=Calidifontibacillus erzurumensis TaxID=2741433 RepID=UPI0035B50625